MTDINQVITDLENVVAQLKEAQPQEIDKECYVNAYNQYFDGLKFVNTPETAINITAYPTMYRANLYYKRTIDGVTTLYVCMPEPTIPLHGVLTEENFSSVMVEWEV